MWHSLTTYKILAVGSLAVAGVAEVKAMSLAATPADWLVENAGLFIAIAGGLVGYGALKQKLESGEQHRGSLQQRVETLQQEKAEKDDVNRLEERIEAHFAEMRRQLEALHHRIDQLLQSRPP